MRSRILLGLLFGAGGAFIGYLIQEVTQPHDVQAELLSPLAQQRVGAIIGMLVGGFLGAGIGMVEGAATSSPRTLMRGAVLGGVIGAIGGLFGIYFGSAVFTIALMGKQPEYIGTSGNMLDFVHMVIARALGWTFLGAFPGLAAGAATLSPKRAMHGLVGGLIGGFLGGVLFDIVGTAVGVGLAPAAAMAQEQRFGAGAVSRAIGFTLIGALTGLFIGLVEEFLKQAWVRVLAGRNEGRDYIISKALTVLGRDERADVPLFGDPSLAPQHAAIKMEGGRHVLLDGHTPLGSVVNGQRVAQQQLLRDGDMIQLGQVRILFREKATAAKIGRPVADAPKAAQAPGAVQMPSHLCPFCGAPKDASGNCLCTVPSTAPAPMPGPAPMGPPVGASAYQPAVGPPAVGYQVAPDPFAGSPGLASGLTVGMPGQGTRLVAMDGPYAGQSFAILGQSVALGREPGKDISLTLDNTVSRAHAHIADEGGHHVVYDDGSSNGTFVNNVRVTVQPLAPGDVVQFGASRFRYE